MQQKKTRDFIKPGESNVMTVCVIRSDDDKVLLKLAARGINEGNYAGPGGKILVGEDSLLSVIREVKEETGLDVLPKYAGCKIYADGGEKFRINYYYAEKFRGLPISGEEGEVKWFKISEIPYEKMRPEEKYLMPMVLNGVIFKAYDVQIGPNNQYSLKIITDNAFYFVKDGKLQITFQTKSNPL